MKDFSKNLVVHRTVENPTCEVEGCSHTAQWTGNIRKDGSRTYRRHKEVGYICSHHHHKSIAKKHGLSSMAEVVAKNAGFDSISKHRLNLAKKAGFDSISEYRLHSVKEAGFDSISEYLDYKAKEAGFENHANRLDHRAKEDGFETHRQRQNSKHPYRKHRKDYCENVDGRLGFICTTTIVHSVQLDVDHKDGNHLNNDLDNLQTLCKCCHSYKGLIYEDYKSPGRRTRKVA